MVGEAGAGKTTIAKQAIAKLPDKKCAHVSYIKGKKAICDLAEALGIETTEPKYNKNGEEVGDRNLTQDELQEEILLNASPNWALFIDDADRWTLSIRLWLQLLEEKGASLILICTKKKKTDIFLHRAEIEMSEPDIFSIREAMKRHAHAIAHPLTPNEIAELQQYAGANFKVAKRVVEQHKQGLKIKPDQHRQTIVTGPYVVALLGGFAVLRFWGMGTGDRTLYIFGGVCLALFMVLKTAGAEIMKPRKGLGQ